MLIEHTFCHLFKFAWQWLDITCYRYFLSHKLLALQLPKLMIKQQETPPHITPETQSRISEGKERGCWESLWRQEEELVYRLCKLVLPSWSHFENLLRWLNSTSIYSCLPVIIRFWKGVLKTVLKKIREFPNINPGQKGQEMCILAHQLAQPLVFLLRFPILYKVKEWPKSDSKRSASLGQKWAG